MDKLLLSKIKTLLQNCNPDNVDLVKKRLMVNLKPSEADEAYEYFTRIEPFYVFETYKVHASQVIPQYSEYYEINKPVSEMFLDEDIDID